MPSHAFPDLNAIRDARERLGDRVRYTPVWSWPETGTADLFGGVASVLLKLELWQYTGSFKARGALINAMNLDRQALDRGLTAVSAGNHAAAVAYAARACGTDAKVVMPRSANPARVALCHALGAAVELVEDVHAAFERVRAIEAEEGRHFIHPFEGEGVALGTGTLGLEFTEQAEAGSGPLDAVIIPIGGGGLCGGVSRAIKLRWPDCQVIGVEPEGADTMHRSFAAGKPQAIERVDTIADSLGAPHAEAYSYALCRAHVDRLVRISDQAMCESLFHLFHQMKLAVEPAGAAATAALAGPLRGQLDGARVGLVICGANIDPEGFARYLARGARRAVEVDE